MLLGGVGYSDSFNLGNCLIGFRVGDCKLLDLIKLGMLTERSPMLKLPAYFKYSVTLFGIVLTFYILIVGKALFIPFFIAILLAFLLHPLCVRISRWGVHRGIASLLSIILVVIVLGFVIFFLSSQINKIVRDLLAISGKLDMLIGKIHVFFEDKFGVAQQEQTQYFRDSLNNLIQNSSKFLSNTVSATADFFTSFLLVVLSLFFLLYYSNFFKEFLYRLIEKEGHQKLEHIFVKGESVVRSYILGLFMVIVIVGTLNTIGLAILGVEYAVFFGVLAALLTIIPYLGIFIGSLLPIVFVSLTKDSLWYPIGVALVFWFVQFLEGNFITPNIVGNKVSLNPFAAIVALFIGGAVWGPAGMILFIPYMALLKVVFDVIEPLEPYGFLLGNPDEKQKTNKLVSKIKRKWQRHKN